jgi:hypothetical protein
MTVLGFFALKINSSGLYSLRVPLGASPRATNPSPQNFGVGSGNTSSVHLKNRLCVEEGGRGGERSLVFSH